jgi:TetR/AcrR family transcriptional regulator, transcriptional repressor for nem operon
MIDKRGGRMPYPAGHRSSVRARIVESARRLFNRDGFENVSVKQIMAGAGYTHGAFYSYFKSKSDLYVEVLGCFFTDPEWKNRWDGVSVDLDSPDSGAQIVRAYLSRQHFEDVENSCPMVALPNDVRRSGGAVKGAFETVFQAMVAALERSLRNKPGSGVTRAQSIAALCIGGLVVARAMRSEAAADRLRQACMTTALELGGWSARRARTQSTALSKDTPKTTFPFPLFDASRRRR